jgi:hypothetical protein
MGRTFTSFGTGEVIFGTGGADFAHLTLPPGEYVIWAMVPITNTDTDPQTWTVELSASNGAKIDGGSITGRIAPLAESSTEVVPILATCKAPVQTKITFRGFGFNIIAFPNVGGRTCTIVAMETQLV